MADLAIASFSIELFYGGEKVNFAGVMQDDYYPAICRAQGLTADVVFHSIAVDENGLLLPQVRGTYVRAAGFAQQALRISFQARTYHFSHTIEIVRQVHLLGVLSANGYAGGTRFKFPQFTCGLILHNHSSGHMRSEKNAAGDYLHTAMTGTFDEPQMVDRARLGNGMAAYCGWNTRPFYPPLAEPFNDALSINPQGSIIENVSFEGTNITGANDGVAEPGSLGTPRDIYPDFRLVPGASDLSRGDRSGTGTALCNPYEMHVGWSEQDALNQTRGLPYESWFVTSKAAHGLMLLMMAEVRSCAVSHFAGHGIYLFGNNYQGGDFSLITRVQIDGNNGNGLHISGGDVGLITCTSVSSAHNAGWGIVHMGRSAANTFIDCQASYNQQGGFLAPYIIYMPYNVVQQADERTAAQIIAGILAPPPVILPEKIWGTADDFMAVAGGLCLLTCYGESNWSKGPGVIATEHFINHNSVLISCTLGYLIDGHPANFHTFDDNSLLNEGAWTGLGFRPSSIGKQPHNYATGTIGSTIYSNVAMSFTQRFVETPGRDLNYGLATGLLLQHREITYADPQDPEKTIVEPTDYWGFSTINSLNRSPLSISHWHNVDIGDGEIWFENGFFLGAHPRSQSSQRVRLLTSLPEELSALIASSGIDETAAKPAAGGKPMYRWEEGDVILNKAPKPGGHVGWICCRDPADMALRWFPYGNVSRDVAIGGATSYELQRLTLENVDDTIGRWQHEGGELLSNGAVIGSYIINRRVTTRGTTQLNVASATTTLFISVADGVESITLQGVHMFNSGKQRGSVSSASKPYAGLVGRAFALEGSLLQIGI